MRVLLINWQDPENPQAGGAEVYLDEVFGRLTRAGHQVTWLTSGWSGAPRRTRLGGMEVHRTGTRYTFGLACVPYYRRHLAGEPFDVVLESLSKVPVYSPLWVRRPIVLMVHHLFGATAFRQAAPPLAALTWLQERPLAPVYRDVAVQPVSHSTAADLAGRGLRPERMRIIHPGVDIDFFRPSSTERSAQPTFIYLGRLERYKRVDLVVRAFARLIRDVPEARLVVAGRGNQEESLRALAASLGVAGTVRFAGFVTEEEKRDLFRTAWANVFVSPKEGWGITNLEAAACGTATIASDSPGLRESVRDGRTGILVPHGDEARLADAMRTLARDRGLVERLGAGALDFSRIHTWDETTHRTLAHLEHAARGGS